MFILSFENKLAYRTGIKALRDHLAMHRAGHLDITIHAYAGETDRITVRMNLHNLYLDGFRTPSGDWWHFQDAVPWTSARSLPYGGRHADLGTVASTSSGPAAFTPAAKFKIDELKHFDGSMADTLRLALSFLVVVISEATRFATIEANVAGCVAGIETYLPDADYATYMRNWSSLTGTSDPAVSVAYRS